MHTEDGRIAIALFFLAFAIYLFTFSGSMHNPADEYLTFAVTENLVKHRQFDVNQMYWVGEFAALAKFGVDGNLYSKYSPAVALLAVPFYAISLFLPVGGVPSALLLGTVLGAATVALVYVLVRVLGYRRRGAILAALTLAIATPFWIYARTIYNEPATGFVLVVSLLFFALYEKDRQVRWLLLLGVMLGLGVWVRVANGLVLPIYSIALLWLWRRLPLNVAIRYILFFGLPVAVSLVTIGLYNYLRFGSMVETGYGAQETFSTPLEVGLYGLLIGPGRGLLVYAPVFLLSIPFWLVLLGVRTRFSLARTTATANSNDQYRPSLIVWLALIICIMWVLVYARWYGWHGGMAAWGPRYLVPIMPLMVLPLAAIFPHPGRKPVIPLYILAGVLVLLSFAINAPAAFFNFETYMSDIARKRQVQLEQEWVVLTPFFNTEGANSPAIAQYRYMRADNIDVAWLKHVDGSVQPTGITVFAVSFLLLGAIACFLLILRKHKLPIYIPLIATILVTAILLSDINDHPVLTRGGDYPAALSLGRELATGQKSAILTLDPDYTLVAFNYDKSVARRYGLSKYDAEPLKPEHLRLLEQIRSGYERVIVIMHGDPSAGGVEAWLSRNGQVIPAQNFGSVRVNQVIFK